MAATFAGCSNNKHPFVFHTPQEAVVTCHEELAKVKMMNSANIDELAQVINTWTELQDSTMSLMMRDSTMTVHNDLASEFFAEAFADVYSRGANARPVSIAVVKEYERRRDEMKNRPTFSGLDGITDNDFQADDLLNTSMIAKAPKKPRKKKGK